jgi:hypothetical protein
MADDMKDTRAGAAMRQQNRQNLAADSQRMARDPCSRAQGDPKHCGGRVRRTG